MIYLSFSSSETTEESCFKIQFFKLCFRFYSDSLSFKRKGVALKAKR